MYVCMYADTYTHTHNQNYFSMETIVFKCEVLRKRILLIFPTFYIACAQQFIWEVTKHTAGFQKNMLSVLQAFKYRMILINLQV